MLIMFLIQELNWFGKILLFNTTASNTMLFFGKCVKKNHMMSLIIGALDFTKGKIKNLYIHLIDLKNKVDDIFLLNQYFAMIKYIQKALKSNQLQYRLQFFL